ncbi:MAG: class I SAM-dependent methyltransferase [Thermoplasmatota archaeon]
MGKGKAIDSSPLIYDLVLAPMELVWFSRWRRRMLFGLKGEVLDIGSGTGANLRHYPHSVDCVTVLDPSTHNISYLKRKAGGGGWGERGGRCLKAEVGVGEKLPFPSKSFDAVVSTLILCTVDDPGKVVSEGIRVLKRGGKFIFIEHQLPRWKPQALLFNAFTPIWEKPSGCRLNRETGELVRSRKELFEELSMIKGPVLGYPFFLGEYRKK